MYNNAPIGVFDSGVGGVSVLKELYSLMPNEDFIYFGDSKNAPYGTKTTEQIKELTIKNTKYLKDKGVKAVVIACNTATSVGVKAVRELFDVPIIGIEPALKPAVLFKKNPVVLVMATPLTLKEDKFLSQRKFYENDAKIHTVACPELVEFAEKGILSSEELTDCIKGYFDRFKDIKFDAVVLGCTHYPFFKPVIREVLGEGVEIFDGGKGTALYTMTRLKDENLLAEGNKKGKVFFENSADDLSLISLSEKLFNI